MNKKTGTKPKTQKRNRSGAVPRPTSAFLGHTFRPPLNPPDVTMQPFNQLTVVNATKHTNGSYEPRVSDLVSWIKAQVDPRGSLTPTANKRIVWQFKLHTVKAWNLVGKTLAFSIFDFTRIKPSDNRDPQLTSSMDTAGKDSYACCAYHYSDMHRNTILRSDEDADVPLWNFSVAAGDTVLTYVTLLWKFEGPITGPSHSVDVVSEILNNTNKMRTVLLSNNRLLSAILEKQPSLIERTINGIAEIGSVVVPAAADDELISTLKQLITVLDDSKSTDSYEKVEKDEN